MKYKSFVLLLFGFTLLFLPHFNSARLYLPYFSSAQFPSSLLGFSQLPSYFICKNRRILRGMSDFFVDYVDRIELFGEKAEIYVSCV